MAIAARMEANIFVFIGYKFNVFMINKKEREKVRGCRITFSLSLSSDYRVKFGLYCLSVDG